MASLIVNRLKIHYFLPLFISLFAVQPLKATPPLDQINPILDIFSHCNLIVKFTQNPTKLTPTHPLLIYFDENFQIPINHSTSSEKFLFENVSFVRRRQVLKFCWTYIFPDMGSNFLLSNLLRSPFFPQISGSFYPIHLIWMVQSVNLQKEMEKISEKVLSAKIYYFASREFYFVPPTLRTSIMPLYHLNLYYPLRTVTSDLEKFKMISKIRCDLNFSSECYQSIENSTDKLALAFNKFSWVCETWVNYTARGPRKYTTKFIAMQKKHFQYSRNPD